MGTTFLYVGTFSTKGQGGIGIYRYNPEDGSAEYIETVREDVVSGLIYIDKKRRVLYSIDERRDNPDFGGKGGGRVFAFSIDGATGALTEISRQSSFGTMPAYLTPDKTGDYLLVCSHSDYQWCSRVSRDITGKYNLEIIHSDSTIVLYPLEPGGAIGLPCDVRIFPTEGGFHSCLHCVELSPDGKFFAVCERNQNKIHFLRLDYDKERLDLCSTLDFPWGDTFKSGHTPRYGVFHPSKPLFYFNSEYKPFVTTVRYSETGGLETVLIQDVTPQIPGLENASFSLSDICISTGGKFLYALYRVINAICVFRIDGETGLPEMIQSLQMEGEGPRGFSFSPDGRFLLVANRDSGDILTLAVHEDGTVRQTGARTFGLECPGNLSFYCV